MKILNTEQIRQADAFTIQSKHISSIDLMERASQRFCEAYIEHFPQFSGRPVWIFCGTGNNGGDGLVIARLLYRKKIKVSIMVFGDPKMGSPDFMENWSRIVDRTPLKTQIHHQIWNPKRIPVIPDDAVIIDALVGSGLNKPLTGDLESLVMHLNALPNPVISVDVPTGLFADRPTQPHTAIRAMGTISFQVPKLAFMMPNNYEIVGEWYIADIGLDEAFIGNADTPFSYLLSGDLKSLLKPRGKFSHKGNFGHSLIVAGSKGKMGAAMLATSACLRLGSGLTTAWVPGCGYFPMQSALPEAMLIADPSDETISQLPDNLDRFNAVAIGPGLGQSASVFPAVSSLLQLYSGPLVIDADGLNLLASQRELLHLITHRAILTPHPGEFRRLAGEWKDDFHRIELLREFAMHYKVIVVFKGAHTAIAVPDGNVKFNSSGNPALAKGGSGDVLTGMICSLLAQGYNLEDAAVLGVHLHGLAADVAVKELDMRCVLATDLIKNFSRAFEKLKNS
jgi:NAD(P)H-hydrate epimerase